MKLVFLDIETTGLNPDIHDPIEIAVCVVDTERCKDVVSAQCNIIFSQNVLTCPTYNECIKLSANQWESADVEALNVNGFNSNCVWNGSLIEDVQESLLKFLNYNNVRKDHAVFVCQNPAFDRMFFHKIIPLDVYLNEDMPSHWLDLCSVFLGSIIDNRFYHGNEFRIFSKDEIANEIGLAREESPHKALNGVKHLIDCYLLISKKGIMV
jgi:DNA polymerase-3 subunit epsilon/oligoribonuclease